MHICIVGAGASGLMAAVQGATAGHSITLMEKNDAPGRKLRSTGNGRCNLSNISIDKELYYSDDRNLLSRVLDGFSSEDTVSFFASRGVLLRVMNGTGIYPYSGQGGIITDVLVRELKRLGVNILCNTRVVSVKMTGDRFSLPSFPGKDDKEMLSLCHRHPSDDASHQWKVTYECPDGVHSRVFDRVILCCGSPAGLGNKERGIYNTESILHRMGIHCNSFVPSLTGIECFDGGNSRLSKRADHIDNGRNNLSAIKKDDRRNDLSVTKDDRRNDLPVTSPLSGIRARGSVSLYDGADLIHEEEGEIQFTDTGLSGIVIFNICRYLRFDGNEIIYLDLLRDDSLNSCHSIMKETFSNPEFGYMESQELLSGIVHKKLGVYILRQCHIHPQKSLKELKMEDIEKIYDMLRHLPFKPLHRSGVEKSQVCRGGVPLSALTDNLEVKGMPGIYICGEMADVDGPCGGYNLQWAFSSANTVFQL